MARKLDRAEPAHAAPRIPHYANDVTQSLVRVTQIWMSVDYHAQFGRSSGIPDEPHAVATIFQLVWRGPLRPSALATSLGVSAAATSRLIETLANAGLVTRTPDPDDARATLIALTEQGVVAATALHDEGDRLSQRLLAGWTDDERSTFTRLLHRYADAVEDDARAAQPTRP